MDEDRLFIEPLANAETVRLAPRGLAALNCSVMQYLGFVRLSRAKELLATSDKSMDEISALCGYSSPNYFCLIFKKASEYRQESTKSQVKFTYTEEMEKGQRSQCFLCPFYQ